LFGWFLRNSIPIWTSNECSLRIFFAFVGIKSSWKDNWMVNINFQILLFTQWKAKSSWVSFNCLPADLIGHFIASSW
jgi:hypothetical protein